MCLYESTPRAVLFKNSPRGHEEHEVFLRYVNRSGFIMKQIKSKSIRPALVDG